MDIFIIGFWVLCSIGAAMIAQSKGRSAGGWFMVGLIFGPIALLIVGFMGAGDHAVAFTPGSEAVIYSEGKVRVTNQRLLVGNSAFAIKSLQAVAVTKSGSNNWEIKLRNLSGKTIYTLDSDNQDRIHKIAKAINDGIMTPAGADNVASSTDDVGSGASTKSSAEVLVDLKRMLDADLITSEDFDKKKEEILSRM